MTRTIELNQWPTEEVRWYSAPSFDSESWHGGASREVVMARVREDYGSDPGDEDTGVVCWIASGAHRRPDFTPSPEALTALLADFIGHNEECWFEENPVEPDEPESVGDLSELITQVLEHCIDPPTQRMIDDFLTLEAVVRRDGELVIDPTIIP